MTGTVICVVHSRQSRTGRVGSALRELGFEERRCCPKAGEPLPRRFDGVAGVCVFGGPMSANDDGRLDFMARELAWIETVVAREVPFLGICLGGQMLARVLGAAVEPHDEGWHEIGFHPIRATEIGRPWMGGLSHVYQWHSEGFGLPHGCELLATDRRDRFPHQAFRYGDRTFGLQFHPECTADIVRTWMRGGRHKLSCPGAQTPREQIEGLRAHDDDVDAWTRGFLARWLKPDAPAPEPEAAGA